MFTITKLDKRYSGCKYFAYKIHFGFLLSKQTNYILARNWCWNTFGPSTERDLYIVFKDKLDVLDNTVWCFHLDTSTYKNGSLYFKSDRELSLFLLKWSPPNGL